jgi:predicted ATPase
MSEHACSGPCRCPLEAHTGRRIVVTGGPGAGKTALLELVRRNFCPHVVVLPESASILFGGGFPRRTGEAARKAAQRAIYHVERELEAVAADDPRTAVVLCDRGTLDGAAYWPASAASFFDELGTSAEAEYARYAAVIHLRTPGDGSGYNHSNPLRTESAGEARILDERIAAVWRGHPRLFEVAQTADFLDKVARALALIRAEVPACCIGEASSALAAGTR